MTDPAVAWIVCALCVVIGYWAGYGDGRRNV
ncbi:MAG: hypothetical protein RLZZ387_2602 [Chloroflexota bacterium]|jgi:hypothetical protein